MLKAELIEKNENLLKQNGELMYLLEFGKLRFEDSKGQMIWERDSNIWLLQNRINKAINNIDILQEIIYQQPTNNKEDDFWLLDKLDGIKNELRGDKND